ncbi:MAG TPA: hypothetical protein VMV99_08445 [Rhodanobacter sp.]|nr:hypothetical protein [Rhodanobacter sp.]
MSPFLSTAPGRRGVLLYGLPVMVALAMGTLWYSHVSAQAAAAHAAANDSNGVTVLLGLADSAFHEHRLVAPIGSNVYEFYLSVLPLDPGNKLAMARLHEAFMPACDEVEREIGEGHLDEAQRELRLLRDYDVNHDQNKNNYKLALLGSYLDAQRTLLIRKHEAEAQQIRERLTAAAAGEN